MLVILTVLVVVGTGAGMWHVLDVWRTLMVARAGFIAGLAQGPVPSDMTGALSAA